MGTVGNRKEYSMRICSRLFTLAVGLAVGITGVLPAATTMAQADTAGAMRPYRINPGDELEIYVWGDERLQRAVRVLPDGTFAFPLVGQINALQKLPVEIERDIAQHLASQYREQVPQVTVSVKDPAGLQFAVAGKVRSPGTFNPGRYVNVLEAISMAGGPSEFANLNEVTVIRKEGEKLTAIKVQLSDLIKGRADSGAMKNLLQLQSGDSVVVP